MKKGVREEAVRLIEMMIIIVFAGLSVFSVVPRAFAQQTITTPYWCGSYWASTPCGGYNDYYSNQNYYGTPYYSNYNTYPYQYPYGYNYYTYPYQYGYPYSYNAYPQPTCNITYTVTNNPNYWSGGMYHEAIQLTWSSNYASSAYISNVGVVSPSGTRVVYPYGYSQYTLTVYGPGGQNSCSTYYQPQQYYQPYPQYYWNQYNYNYGYNYGYPYAW